MVLRSFKFIETTALPADYHLLTHGELMDYGNMHARVCVCVCVCVHVCVCVNVCVCVCVCVLCV